MSKKQLRRNSPLNTVLLDHLGPDEYASVLSDPHKGGTEVDADLYQMQRSGRAHRIKHIHLRPDLRERQP